MNHHLRLRSGFRLFGITGLALTAYLVLALCFPHGAHADSVLGSCPGANGINQLPNVFCTSTTAWLGNALSAAQEFFFSLVAIELAWSAILYVLQKENLGELLASFVIKLMGVFFFYAILLNAGTWIPAILSSFIALSGKVTGSAAVVDPMSVLNIGLNECQKIFTNLPQTGFYFNLLNLGDTIRDDLTIAFCMLVAVIFAALVCLIIFVCFLIAAAQVIIMLVECYIMIAAGAVMLGFLGSRWTLPFAEKFIGYTVSTGVKLFVAYIVIGLYTALGITWAQDLSTISAIHFGGAGDIHKLGPMAIAYLDMGASAIIFAMLVTKIPSLASSVMNGAPSMSMGAMVTTAASLGGAAMGISKAAMSATVGAATSVGSNIKVAAQAARAATAGGARGAGGANGGGLTGTTMDAVGVSSKAAMAMKGPGASLSSQGNSSVGVAQSTIKALGSPTVSSTSANSVSQERTALGADSSSGVNAKSNNTASGRGSLAKAFASNTADTVTSLGEGAMNIGLSAAQPLQEVREDGGGGGIGIGLRMPE